jgi:4-diphosphocytidyl-2-C-methyl-D-erythritol kinase
MGEIRGNAEVRLRAFAKVNYALEVLGLREDGYHEIRTVFQSVSLADEVEITRAGEGFGLVVEPGGTEIGPAEDNTTFKAWKVLRGLAGAELPARVRLHKHIPAGAGLGGASADAAAVLVGLNVLFGLGLDAAALLAAAAEVGADVPFCVRGGTALGEGVGEVLEPLPAPPEHYLLVVKPAAAADTGEIYRLHDRMPHADDPPAAPVVRALEEGDLRALADSVGNALAPATKKLLPEVGGLEEDLRDAGALGAAMTGSGTAVYGIFGSEAEVRRAVARVRAPFVGACRPVGRGVEVL